MIYNNIKINHNNILEIKNKVLVSFIKGPKVEIVGDSSETYQVQFINNQTDKLLFETDIKNNHWAKANAEYFIDWKIKVFKNGDLFYEENYNPIDKRVYIAIDSKALGDTLAWFPYIEEFGKKYNCKIITSTFHNDLLKENYPNIDFVSPGDTVNNLYAMYSLGLFYTEDDTVNLYKNPNDPKSVPMQKIATDILGLDYTEIRPKINRTYPKKDNKLITIAIHGTAQPKYWNNPNGWQEVVDWLNGRGYRVKLLSRENDGYMGNSEPKGIEKLPEGSLDVVINELEKSNMFIGIGSGLSWLSWATETNTVLISGFSYGWTEMTDCIRINPPKSSCSGCFNRYKLDAGDWTWCPDHKNTDKQFECTKTITGKMVIDELKKVL